MPNEKKDSAKSRYDPAAIAALAALEPVRARGSTIINSADLSEIELERICRIIAENLGIWQVEVTDKKGRTTRIYRDL